MEAMAERVRALYNRLWLEAVPVTDGKPCVVTGHLTVLGGQESPHSERPIFIGGQQGAPLDVFPAEAAYIALGHLHRAQSFAGGRIRYSGSPFPMSATERRYSHRTIRVDTGPTGIDTLDLPVPRPVLWLRLPEAGALTPEDVVAALNSRLEEEGIDSNQPCDQHPFVEIELAVDVPRPHIGAQLVADIRRAGLAARIVGISVDAHTSGSTVAGGPHAAPDSRHTPQQMFEAAFARAHGGLLPTAEHNDVLRLVLETLAP
jgi:exonuclease SbcD